LVVVTLLLLLASELDAGEIKIQNFMATCRTKAGQELPLKNIKIEIYQDGKETGTSVTTNNQGISSGAISNAGNTVTVNDKTMVAYHIPCSYENECQAAVDACAKKNNNDGTGRYFFSYLDKMHAWNGGYCSAIDFRNDWCAAGRPKPVNVPASSPTGGNEQQGCPDPNNCVQIKQTSSVTTNSDNSKVPFDSLDDNGCSAPSGAILSLLAPLLMAAL
ncbi:hypothetical protein PFISCL1PPCAC_19029, partial [Pristionchus fissidentatus]